MAVIRETRPWSSEVEVARGLLRWAGDDVDKFVCADVAHWLAEIGRHDATGSDLVMALLTRDLLLTALRGWPLREFEWLYEFGAALPARTRRRHRTDGMGYVRSRARRERTLRALVLGGRTESAARRWMQRNPGKPAKDAPPPQRRG
jgi:hypothetical protein